MITTVIESNASVITTIHALIPDFGDQPDAAHFESRCAGHNHIYLAAYIKEQAAGYLAAYDRYGDGSYYCWMAGTVPALRGQGVLTALMTALEDHARARGYKSIRIKTRQKWEAMRHWLAAHEYIITKVENHTPMADNRIHLIKAL